MNLIKLLFTIISFYYASLGYLFGIIAMITVFIAIGQHLKLRNDFNTLKIKLKEKEIIN